jgi:hypothetical protein
VRGTNFDRFRRIDSRSAGVLESDRALVDEQPDEAQVLRRVRRRPAARTGGEEPDQPLPEEHRRHYLRAEDVEFAHAGASLLTDRGIVPEPHPRERPALPDEAAQEG